MTFKGVIKGCTIQLSGPSGLPDGTRIEMVWTSTKAPLVSQKEVNKTSRGARRSRSSEIGKKSSATAQVRGTGAPDNPLLAIIENAISGGHLDGAAEHDHYIYGTPKRASRTRAKPTTKPTKKTRARA